MMMIKFKGTVLLPSLGRWEIGIVQNLLNCREVQKYSEGGQFSFETSFLRTLDVLNGATDIWLDTLGSGVATFDIKKSNTRVSIDLSAGDVPRSPQFPAIRKRCKGTITETIVSAERTNEFAAALIARNNGVLFPLASTDDPYGYSYVFDVPSGGGFPDMSWLSFKTKFSKKITRPPFTVAGRAR
jgi:hypothetical protein